MNGKGKYKIETITIQEADKKKVQAKSAKRSRYFSIYDYDKLDNVYFFCFLKRRERD